MINPTIHISGYLTPEYYPALLEGLIAANIQYLQQNPETPYSYESGVIYRREPPRTERWKPIPAILHKGFGDCEDLVAWRIAELRLMGFPATTHVMETSTGYHAVVDIDGSGNLEDPSIALGMLDQQMETTLSGIKFAVDDLNTHFRVVVYSTSNNRIAYAVDRDPVIALENALVDLVDTGKLSDRIALRDMGFWGTLAVATLTQLQDPKKREKARDGLMQMIRTPEAKRGHMREKEQEKAKKKEIEELKRQIEIARLKRELTETTFEPRKMDEMGYLIQQPWAGYDPIADYDPHTDLTYSMGYDPIADYDPYTDPAYSMGRSRRRRRHPTAQRKFDRDRQRLVAQQPRRSRPQRTTQLAQQTSTRALQQIERNRRKLMEDLQYRERDLREDKRSVEQDFQVRIREIERELQELQRNVERYVNELTEYATYYQQIGDINSLYGVYSAYQDLAYQYEDLYSDITFRLESEQQALQSEIRSFAEIEHGLEVERKAIEKEAEQARRAIRR